MRVAIVAKEALQAQVAVGLTPTPPAPFLFDELPTPNGSWYQGLLCNLRLRIHMEANTIIGFLRHVLLSAFGVPSGLAAHQCGTSAPSSPDADPIGPKPFSWWFGAAFSGFQQVPGGSGLLGILFFP